MMETFPLTSECGRVAIFIAPPEHDPWWEFGSGWLGRDALSGEPSSLPTIDANLRSAIEIATRSPRHYGFHGTLVPPFVLAPETTLEGLRTAIQDAVEDREALDVRLALRELRGFLALVPDPPEPELNRLAAGLLHAVNRFRAPEAAEERATRNRPGLSREERRMLQVWGYPYVLGTFRFHMTLTGALDSEASSRVLPILSDALGDQLSHPLPVRDVCLFHQSSRDAPFRLRERFGFDRSHRQFGELQSHDGFG